VAKQARLTQNIYRPRKPDATSFLMSRVRSENTQLERRLRSELHRCGLRFRKNCRDLVGRPDISFKRERIAIFIDGDFWHGRILQERGLKALSDSLKTENRDFWIAKISRNVSRDGYVSRELETSDWKVPRFWETDLKKNLKPALDTILSLHAERRLAFQKGG
jgi:DNA mismatch endonuclease (patch repair protein)